MRKQIAREPRDRRGVDLAASLAVAQVHAREVYDSRGNPTVEVEVTAGGRVHLAQVCVVVCARARAALSSLYARAPRRRVTA